MNPYVSSSTTARQPLNSSPDSPSQRVRDLQRRLSDLRGQLAAAGGMYAMTLAPIHLLRQQQLRAEIERCQRQLWLALPRK